MGKAEIAGLRGAIQIKKDQPITLGGYQTDMETLYRQVMPENTTKQEFGLFLAIAKSFELNPYKREIYAIKYGGQKMQIVAGYETYIKRAERTGKLDGWEVKIADDDESATITIYRKDWDHPFIWTVERAEFDKSNEAKTDKNPWVRMPRFMLKKVAIGQGFRLCFSDEIGGMPYLQEEIGAGVNPDMIIDGNFSAEIEEDYAYKPEPKPEPKPEKKATPKAEKPAEEKLKEQAPPPQEEKPPVEPQGEMTVDGAIAHIQEIDNRKHLENWYRKHSAWISKQQIKDKANIILAYDQRNESFDLPPETEDTGNDDGFNPATVAQSNAIKGLAKTKGMTDEALVQFCRDVVGVDDVADMTYEQASEIITKLQE